MSPNAASHPQQDFQRRADRPQAIRLRSFRRRPGRIGVNLPGFISRTGAGPARAGFTFIEMLIVIVLITIAAAMAIPAMSSNDSTYARAGADIMISDLDFAQATAINQPSEDTVVHFDSDTSRWWVTPESTPDTPYPMQYSTDVYDATMGAGRAQAASGATFTLTNVTSDQISYNAFGQLEQSTDPVITITCNTYSVVITIDAETGFLETRSVTN